jgi:hypothetical protein
MKFTEKLIEKLVANEAQTPEAHIGKMVQLVFCQNSGHSIESVQVKHFQRPLVYRSSCEICLTGLDEKIEIPLGVMGFEYESVRVPEEREEYRTRAARLPITIALQQCTVEVVLCYCPQLDYAVHDGALI